MLNDRVCRCARNALLREIDLTPKPGLVDRNNNGSHIDMDYNLFCISIETITPFFGIFCQYGRETAFSVAHTTLPGLREIGIKCERQMLAATDRVNTHKGAIFSLALLCCSVGRLEARGEIADISNVCRETSLICRKIIETDFHLAAEKTPQTSGEKIYRRYGLAGARGEAVSGFETVRLHAWPTYKTSMRMYNSREKSELIALICLISRNNDSNIIARAGLTGLDFARGRAFRALSILEGKGYEDFLKDVWAMNDEFMALNISPGGSADLLSVLGFFENIDQDISCEAVC
ncbi:triphosphoribosyl-dephospho-CoA synthase CitG [Acetobacter suratthaniensis]|uniref:triphosphoribosyl-dephospho-CoA synthase n=1 Tax=Acetobacter suratthaniensis TaxID=1502841 RepID=A0ABS3LQA5_9PROT|nr:triphosphoribosyl-dephospho-CoA synthase CitG [Acetobacter suratthaniensis]MBO1329540.1 triphosphoribosyl-dephospho-CoA synthase CitG [Acetobacter suratthaniensis]MCX2567406.1 triphosphoribosyl-dephospho-CoA synthase CitG [Acetobacter suratthaniensis]